MRLFATAFAADADDKVDEGFWDETCYLKG